MIGLALPLQAQTEIIDDDESTEDSDTLATDSLWSDSLSAKGDTLPWPHNVQAQINALLQTDLFRTF